MNKKKKNTRIKHRKNQNRVKKLKQSSLLKAKPKRTVNINQPDVDIVQEKITEKVPAKKSGAIKTPLKKASTKKSAAKKTTTKKAATKKTTTKKAATKKTTTKKAAK